MKIQLVCLLSLVQAVVFSQGKSFRFDFGSEKPAQGYIAVTPHTLFSAKTGYGFSHQSTPVAVRRKGDPLEGTFITSDKPIYFSVILPEGNYDIKVLLGDKKGVSSTIIRAECRRLMTGQTTTEMGEILSKEFSIHLRDSMIRDAAGKIISKVKLKPRESAFLHWDNLLTLEFNDSLPKICALEIKPNLSTPTIFLAGNSTVVDQDKEPWAAWGQMFPAMIVPGKAIVANYAESGEAMRSFKGANRLEATTSSSSLRTTTRSRGEVILIHLQPTWQPLNPGLPKQENATSRLFLLLLCTGEILMRQGRLSTPCWTILMPCAKQLLMNMCCWLT